MPAIARRRVCLASIDPLHVTADHQLGAEFLRLTDCS